jgi:phosphoglycerate dehydrogenase-like enzyme
MAEPKKWTIWCNASFPPAATDALKAGIGLHHLLFPEKQEKSILAPGGSDPLLEQADIAFGQPDAMQICRVASLKWIQLTSAGYTRYDRDDVKAALRSRGGALTNSSAVFAEPCAQHALAMMLAFSRQLPQCLDEQRGDRAWRQAAHRNASFRLRGQSVVMLGFGAIARRLVEMLEPFAMNVSALRRTPAGNEAITVFTADQLDNYLARADHVVNILPANAQSEHFFSAARLGRMKRSAFFYNIGRGDTVDQPALLAALNARQIAGAYLDVMEPEPLPKAHPLWSAPNCFITPHTAGGHAGEEERLVAHFLKNLRRFEREEALVDRVV